MLVTGVTLLYSVDIGICTAGKVVPPLNQRFDAVNLFGFRPAEPITSELAKRPKFLRPASSTIRKEEGPTSYAEIQPLRSGTILLYTVIDFVTIRQSRAESNRQGCELFPIQRHSDALGPR